MGELQPVTEEASEAIEIVAAVLTSDDKTEAAKKLGVSRMTLWRKIQKYGLETYLEQIPIYALTSFKGAGLKAALNIISDLDSKNEKVRQSASRYVLDKILPERALVQINAMQVNQFKELTDEQLDALIKQTANKVGAGTITN